MNRIVCTFVTESFLAAGIAVAQSSNNSKNTKAHEITDSQMNNITAGQTDNNSIAVAGSTVTTSETATGSLAGSSLSSAAA